jgi:hypothetical protein
MDQEQSWFVTAADTVLLACPESIYMPPKAMIHALPVLAEAPLVLSQCTRPPT